MADEGMPPGPPRFPPVEDSQGGYTGWSPPPTAGGPYPAPYQYGTPQPGPSGSGHWLHPLDLGRAFSSGFRAYRANWKAMIAAILAFALPIGLINALYQAFVAGPAMAAWQEQYNSAILRGDLSGLPVPPATTWLSLLIGVVAAVLGILAGAAVVHIVDASYNGGRADFRDGASAALRRTGTIVGALLLLFFSIIGLTLVGGLATVALASIGFVIGSNSLATLLALIGVVSTVVALIFFAVRWCLYTQVIMCEDGGIVASLRRSWRLVSGSTWRVAGYLLLLGLMVLLVSVLLGIPVGLIAVIAAGGLGRLATPADIAAVYSDPTYVLVVSLFGVLISALVTPWYLSVLTLLYYDLRWRKGELAGSAAVQPSAAPYPGAPSI